MCWCGEMRNFAVVDISKVENILLQRLATVVVLHVLVCMDAAAQHRIIVVDMETNVPIRNVIVQYYNGKTDTTIWDGSFVLDSIVADTCHGDITLRRSGYMMRKLNYEELTDTIDLLPSFNALTEVVVYGVNKQGKFGWSFLKPYGPQMPSKVQPGFRADISGVIDRLFSYKRRKRLNETKKRMAEY